MRGMPENSVDSIVTDPPYELSFMGRKWDGSGIAYSVEMWAEALRVLKPGGHLLAFGGTRTYHRMACAIEDAGFEIRDSIHWVYGSGFPKSLNVGKAIDKAAGAEREVVGSKRVSPKGIGAAETRSATAAGSFGGEAKDVPVTAPATEEAARWEGWGTALKPAHEPIVVARKPLAGTVAGNVLVWGTGGLNIDGCRVGMGDEYDPSKVQRQQRSDGAVQFGSAGLIGTEIPTYNAQGRWPANVVWSHSPNCVPAGTRKVPSNTPAVWKRDKQTADGRRDASSYAVGSPESGEVRSAYGDSDGTETVTAWECDASCPVAALDRQSGVSKDGVAVNRNRSEDNQTSWYGTRRSQVGDDVGYGGAGGASRFFTQADFGPDDWPFVYQAKPSRKERNAGLDEMPEREPLGSKRSKPAVGRDSALGAPRANHHPTVKPVALMRHLVRLVTPPGGTVLDPFAGSGTTLVAAILERMVPLGCEMTDEYLPIIEGRMAWAHEHVAAAQDAETNPAQPTLL
jgi:site-specific DNA-methyltransferase (adenine-specific)